MQCVKCGHDPAARVTASWTFETDRQVESLNARNVNVHGWRGGVYKRDRDAWQWVIKVERINQRIPTATGRRRVTLTRLYSGRQHEFDRDNFSGGAKIVMDAIVREGLLVDDKNEWAEVIYVQERGTVSGLRVLLEEIS